MRRWDSLVSVNAERRALSLRMRKNETGKVIPVDMFYMVRVPARVYRG
mgnify:CR=1 FL=1